MSSEWVVGLLRSIKICVYCAFPLVPLSFLVSELRSCRLCSRHSLSMGRTYLFLFIVWCAHNVDGFVRPGCSSSFLCIHMLMAAQPTDKEASFTLTICVQTSMIITEIVSYARSVPILTNHLSAVCILCPLDMISYRWRFIRYVSIVLERFHPRRFDWSASGREQSSWLNIKEHNRAFTVKKTFRNRTYVDP